MENFELWQKKLDAGAEAALGGVPATETLQPLSAIDQEYHDLCLTQTSSYAIEEAYKQLLVIGDELGKELAVRQLGDYQKYVETQIEQLRQLHDSGELEHGDALAKYHGKFWSLSKGLWARANVVK